MLAAVILSGGASRRMGSPKALLPFQGRTFLEHLIEATVHPKIGARRVVLGPDAQAIRSTIPVNPEEIVVNEKWQEGQLSSIQVALRSLPAGTDGMLLALIDHPLVSAALIAVLIERFYSETKSIVLPVYKSRRGHPVIFSSTLYPALLAAPLETGARAVVWAHAGDISEVLTSEEACVLNLNDPEAFAKWKR